MWGHLSSVQQTVLLNEDWKWEWTSLPSSYSSPMSYQSHTKDIWQYMTSILTIWVVGAIYIYIIHDVSMYIVKTTKTWSSCCPDHLRHQFQGIPTVGLALSISLAFHWKKTKRYLTTEIPNQNGLKAGRFSTRRLKQRQKRKHFPNIRLTPTTWAASLNQPRLPNATTVLATSGIDPRKSPVVGFRLRYMCNMKPHQKMAYSKVHIRLW